MLESSDIWYLLSWFFVCLLAVFIGIRQYFQAQERERRASEASEFTSEPRIPAWVLEDIEDRFWRNCGEVQFECRKFHRRTDKFERPLKLKAILWIQAYLAEKYRLNPTKPLIVVPEEACLVSVPMDHFKCDQDPNHFTPESGSMLQNPSYQMCGKDRIQLTFHVENGVRYPAGYCIYIKDPYGSWTDYDRRHLDAFYQGPKYGVISGGKVPLMEV